MSNHPKQSAKNETGETDFERFRQFAGRIVNVPGAEVRQQIEAEKKARAKKRANSSSSRVSRAKD